jgi:hypothetical protein
LPISDKLHTGTKNDLELNIIPNILEIQLNRSIDW